MSKECRKILISKILHFGNVSNVKDMSYVFCCKI